jgi:hypothetical protein
VPLEDDSAALAGADRHNPEDYHLTAPERHRAVQRALADALQLAQLQVDVLARLSEADRAGDDEAVLRCHAELDHVTARLAEADRVRSGAPATVASDGDLTCAGCGAAAQPVYETPRLLGYRCTGCGWTGDDPAAQAERKQAQAKEAAAAAVGRAVQEIGGALATLDQRGKKAREEGIRALRLLHQDLALLAGRLRRTGLSSPLD